LPKTLAEAQLHRLARLGAIARLKEIEEEAAAIRGAFPGLGGTVPSPKGRAPEKRARRKRHMSPAAREAARKRMVDYWAKKKSQAAGTAPGNGAVDQPGVEGNARPRKPRASRRPRAKKAR
jgi:hypothetical protein